MSPFKAIEKWITEHGSAAALRDHLALVKEQMADLKVKKEASDLRASQAEAKVKDLHAQLEDARKQIKTFDGIRAQIRDQRDLENQIFQLKQKNSNLESQLRSRLLGF
jgi:predicted  nucleic acid-binding Zn-ribbon protein